MLLDVGFGFGKLPFKVHIVPSVSRRRPTAGGSRSSAAHGRSGGRSTVRHWRCVRSGGWRRSTPDSIRSMCSLSRCATAPRLRPSDSRLDSHRQVVDRLRALRRRRGVVVDPAAGRCAEQREPPHRGSAAGRGGGVTHVRGAGGLARLHRRDADRARRGAGVRPAGRGARCISSLCRRRWRGRTGRARARSAKCVKGRERSSRWFGEIPERKDDAVQPKQVPNARTSEPFAALVQSSVRSARVPVASRVPDSSCHSYERVSIDVRSRTTRPLSMH